MADSPGSPLSSHASSEFTEDVKIEDRETSFDALPDHAEATIMPPAKRQKLGMSSYHLTPLSQLEAQQEDWECSSDTSGDVPSSPAIGQAYTQDDDHSEQVTVCKWRNCPAGDLHNMDVLVHHIHDDHIGIRQKRYACEWENCPRIDANHPSGYALRAHMRSHTREKPFYCALPECDRAFTRSDALAKHMRTVHETEALRPSDPIPRSHSQAQVKPQRLKLIVHAKPPQIETLNGDVTEADDDTIIDTNTEVEPEPHRAPAFEYPADLHFTEEELAMPPSQLFRLLRRQVHWSEQEHLELKAEVETLEAKRRSEWEAKELVLLNVAEAELATALKLSDDYDQVLKLKNELLPVNMLDMEGPTAWYRIPLE